MGGIGKTTLAAKLFNSVLPGFGDAACFLVRTEVGHAGGTVKLQQELLRALAGSHSSVSDVDSGAPHLRHMHLLTKNLCGGSYSQVACLTVTLGCGLLERPCTLFHDAFTAVAGRQRLIDHLKRRKVLLVIDDTDDVAQLYNLLPHYELHPESLVVITSRKEIVLKRRCKKVSQVQLLPKGRDMMLFKACAFAAGEPVWDMSALVPEVVACCGRLPLTLKVGVGNGGSLLQAHVIMHWRFEVGTNCVCFKAKVCCGLAGHGRPHELFART